jgi:hypothetical protein
LSCASLSVIPERASLWSDGERERELLTAYGDLLADAVTWAPTGLLREPTGELDSSLLDGWCAAIAARAKADKLLLRFSPAVAAQVLVAGCAEEVSRRAALCSSDGQDLATPAATREPELESRLAQAQVRLRADVESSRSRFRREQHLPQPA